MSAATGCFPATIILRQLLTTQFLLVFLRIALNCSSPSLAALFHVGISSSRGLMRHEVRRSAHAHKGVPPPTPRPHGRRCKTRRSRWTPRSTPIGSPILGG